VIGALLFDLRFPGGLLPWLLFAASVPLAVVVSFGIRLLVSASAFWLLDDSGVKSLQVVLAMFFSGLVVPLVLFPGWTRDLAMALPWAAFLQVPADIWLGHREGWAAVEGLAFQAMWAAVLLGICQVVLARARDKVVVQGG
jgi:ABC-2 type transport system permease protein